LKFKNIGINLVKLYSLIISNENISKYVYYLNHNPLASPDVPIDLKKEGYYILSLFDGGIPEEEKIRLFLNPSICNFEKYPLSEISYILELVIPNKWWVLEGLGELRGYAIMDEIAQMIDQQSVAGVGEVEITHCRTSRITGSEYSVLTAIIKVRSVALKGMR